MDHFVDNIWIHLFWTQRSIVVSQMVSCIKLEEFFGEVIADSNPGKAYGYNRTYHLTFAKDKCSFNDNMKAKKSRDCYQISHKKRNCALYGKTKWSASNESKQAHPWCCEAIDEDRNCL